jgi:hypothetical protein
MPNTMPSAVAKSGPWRPEHGPAEHRVDRGAERAEQRQAIADQVIRAAADPHYALGHAHLDGGFNERVARRRPAAG